MSWLGPVAFVVAAVAEYYATVWSINYTRAVTKLPLGKDKMRERVWRAVRWSFLLGLLNSVDYAGAAGGFGVLVWTYPGALLGDAVANYRTLWAKFDATHKRLAEARSADDEEDEE